MPYILKALYLKIVIALVLKSLIGELPTSEVQAHFPTPLMETLPPILSVKPIISAIIYKSYRLSPIKKFGTDIMETLTFSQVTV